VSATDTIEDAAALDSPYVGLNFYTQDNAAMFFGRDAERTVLISNLRASRLTLLYAQSGTGKSSVLRAGVASRLGELARRSFEQRGTARNIPVVFSSWQDEPTDQLIAEIQKTIIPFMPETSPPEVAPALLEEAIEAANIAADATLLIILDQFEEYFLYRSKEVRRGRFANELASCINRADLRANFLISIREDAFSGLGDLFQDRIDNVYGNYLHLEHLNRESARQAIEKPIASFNELHKHEAPFEIEQDLIDAVLGQLRTDQFAPDQGVIGGLGGRKGAGRYAGEIAAPYLQLVMKRLWETELARGSRKLRLETLEELGAAKTIIETHVDRALEGLSDDDREAAGDAFRYLVTPSGTKIAFTASDLADYTGRSADDTAALLERLASSETRILRPIAPPPGREGGTRFEISHDLLAAAILDWPRRRTAAQLEHEKEAAELQARTEKKRARRFRKIAIWATVLIVILVVILAVLFSAGYVTPPAPSPSFTLVPEGSPSGP
jgi:Novel STAND NTPase 1